MKQLRKAGEFVQLLKNEVTRLGSQRAVARGIGLTESRFGRVLSGEHSLSVESCLRFSQLTGESPSRVLRAAGKASVADLIEELYVVDGERVSQSENAMLGRFRNLTAKAQQTVRELLEVLAVTQVAAEAQPQRRRTDKPARATRGR
jgi:plasmid maintenance system antidote protein VapI